MKTPKIVIVDFKLSNIFSVAHACESVGISPVISSDPKDLEDAEGLILPGVGAFGDAMKNLDSFGITSAIKKHISLKKPFLGVCLGMQLLFEESEEFSKHQGLGIFKGNVLRFKNSFEGKKIRVPHIGWDLVDIKKTSKLFKGVRNPEFMYFVHSYFCNPKDRDIIATTTNYEGFEFVSAVSSENVYAVQFHPEKSGKNGPLLYRNFVNLIKNG